MLDATILSELAKCGIDPSARKDAWRGASDLLAALDAIGRLGVNVILKIDGERAGPEVYTVVVSGGRLRDEFFRRDGSDLQLLLSEAVSFFLTHAGEADSDS